MNIKVTVKIIRKSKGKFDDSYSFEETLGFKLVT